MFDPPPSVVVVGSYHGYGIFDEIVPRYRTIMRRYDTGPRYGSTVGAAVEQVGLPQLTR